MRARKINVNYATIPAKNVSGKLEEGTVCVGSISSSVAALPIVPAYVNGKACKMLIDTGCSMSTINKRFVQRCNQ